MSPEKFNKIGEYLIESWPSHFTDADVLHWTNAFDRTDPDRLLAALVDWKNTEKFAPKIPGIRAKVSLIPVRQEEKKREPTYWESEARREGRGRSPADKCIRYWRSMWAMSCQHHEAGSKSRETWAKKVALAVTGDLLAMRATPDAAARWAEAVFWTPDAFRQSIDDLRANGLLTVQRTEAQQQANAAAWTEPTGELAASVAGGWEP